MYLVFINWNVLNAGAKSRFNERNFKNSTNSRNPQREMQLKI